MNPRAAWLAASTTGNASRTTRRGGGAGFNYNRFDKIVDSDDEETDQQQGAAMMPPQMRSMPPEIKLALAKVEAAKLRNDQSATALAMAELEARLQDQPAEFKRTFLGGASAPVRSQLSSAGARSQLLETLPPSDARERLDKQLAEIEQAQTSLGALSADPSKLPEWLAGMGISTSEIDAAERSADPSAAMRKLAERCVSASLTKGTSLAANAATRAATQAADAASGSAKQRRRSGNRGSAQGSSGGADGNGDGDGDGDENDLPLAIGNAKGAAFDAAAEKAKKMLEELNASKARLAEQMEEVAKHKKAAEDAHANVAKQQAELQAAQKKKEEQGKLVDDSVAAARVDIKKQAAVFHEEDKMRADMFLSLKERGNLAMQRRDLTAARSFYSEALEITQIVDEERAKLFGNRAACYVALGYHDLAREDAEQAAELLPEWGKAHYRLGCARDACGDVEGAIEAMRQAVELMPEAAEVRDKLTELEGKRQKPSSKSANDAKVEGARAKEEANVQAEAATKAAAEEASAEKAAAEKAVAKAEAEHKAATDSFVSLKERGNLAMQRRDLTAARSFYSEALEITQIVDEERAKLFGNRAACYVALGYHDLAREDAEQAAELLPEWGKAHYRLGCARDACGDVEGAIEAMRQAVELMPEAAEVRDKLTELEGKRQKPSSKSANSKAKRLPAKARAKKAAAKADAAAKDGTRGRAEETVETGCGDPEEETEEDPEAVAAAEAAEADARAAEAAAAAAAAEAKAAAKRAAEAEARAAALKAAKAARRNGSQGRA